MSHISNKVIVITGAAGGFGKLVAQKAAKLGAKIVAADINDEALATTVAEIVEDGGSALAVRTDVTSAGDMKSLVEAAVNEFGQVDVMFNNAGIMPLAFFSDHDKAMGAWHRCIDINLKGVLNGITAAYDQMIEQGRGHIVNMSSIYGNQPVQGAAVYGATKAAVAFLTEALRQEAHGRIKVTTIRPTGVPGTGISDAVVNPETHVGILGGNIAIHNERVAAMMAGEAPSEWSDSDSIAYFPLNADNLADQIIYVLDQPWGVSISDITVRASADMFVI